MYHVCVKSIAFMTLEEPGDYIIDDELSIGPLDRAGWRVTTLPWRQVHTAWSQFDAVVIRSTWDYCDDLEGFVAVLEDVDASTRLANPLELVRWNLHKTYLQDLENRTIDIVPTLWPDRLKASDFDALFGELNSTEIVVKPVVGASGYDTFRLSDRSSIGRLQGVAECFDDHPAMVQPFMPRILDEGEFSLFYFNGEYSHCVLKTPAIGEFRSQEERGGSVRAVQPPDNMKSLGDRVLATLDGTPLYARVDFVRGETGDFLLMELELVEPSLYLKASPLAPQRFAAAIDRWFAD